MILKNQNNAADTTSTANATASFSTITTASNDTIITPTTTIMITTATTTTTSKTTTTTESKNIATTSTIDTTIPTSSFTPEIVSSASSTASVPSSAIDTTTTTCTSTLPSNSMTDCYDWLHVNGSTLNGVYKIDPGYGLAPFDVYCDMMTDGGGWTVIQRLIVVVSFYSFYLFRQVNDSSEMWKNTWQQYKNGFNNSIENGSLWLGNDRIHVMSSRWNVILRVEIYGDRMPNNTNPNIYLYGKYNFSVNTIST
jgi:hypothetical protein